MKLLVLPAIAAALTASLFAPQLISAVAPSEAAVVVEEKAPRPQWITDVLTKTNTTVADNVEFFIEDGEKNCGTGCARMFTDGSYDIYISPEVYGTEIGEYVLIHEVAHTYGKGECEAEFMAHARVDTEVWGYPQCKTNPHWESESDIQRKEYLANKK